MIERLQIALAHSREGHAIEPGVVGDERDDALAGGLCYAPLGHAEETHVQIVETVSLRRGRGLGCAVSLRQPSLLFHVGDACKTVVRRISEDHQDRGITRVTFLYRRVDARGCAI